MQVPLIKNGFENDGILFDCCFLFVVNVFLWMRVQFMVVFWLLYRKPYVQVQSGRLVCHFYDTYIFLAYFLLSRYLKM